MRSSMTQKPQRRLHAIPSFASGRRFMTNFCRRSIAPCPSRDTAPHGVQKIETESCDGKQYDLDVLIDRLQWMGNLVQRGGWQRQDAPYDGDRGCGDLGIHSNGFPNLFIIGPARRGGQFNFIVGLGRIPTT